MEQTAIQKNNEQANKTNFKIKGNLISQSSSTTTSINSIIKMLPIYEIIVPNIQDSRFGANAAKAVPKFETKVEIKRIKKFLFVPLVAVS